VRFWSVSSSAMGEPVGATDRRTRVQTSGVDLVCWEPELAQLPRRQTLAGFDRWISSAVFTQRSGGQDVVITAGADGFIRRWDVNLESASPSASTDWSRLVDAVAVHGDWVVHISRLSSCIRARALVNGTLAPTTVPKALWSEFFVVDNAPNACIIIDESSQAQLLSWGKPLVPLATEVSRVAASMQSDGTLVVVSTNHTDVTRVHRLVGDELSLLASKPLKFNHDYRTATLRTDETVIVAAAKGGLELWNADSLTLRTVVDIEDCHFPPNLLATGNLPDGRAVAVITAGGQCALIDLDESRRLGPLPGADRVKLGKFYELDDERRVFVGTSRSNQDVVTVWDLERMSPTVSIKVPALVTDLDMSADGLLVLATLSGLITISL